jgi:hypothetical protein
VHDYPASELRQARAVRLNAFDIAGTGQADERSLIEALRQAVALAPRAK